MNPSAPSASFAIPTDPPHPPSGPPGGRETLSAYLQRLFAHMFWADRCVLDLLNRSAVARQAEPTRLFSHLLAAERVWLLRLRGKDSAVQPIWPELAAVELNAMCAANRAGYTRFLKALAPGDLLREIEYVNSRGDPFRTPVLDVLTHLALHGSYHRGQIARAVRGAGEEPVNTDYITYVRELA